MDRLQLRADPSPATTGTSTPKPTSQSDSRLPNGTVAGIVVGVAVGLALISSLITFLIMHRKQSSRGKRLSKNPPDQMSLESVSTRRNRGASKTKETSQIDPAQHHPAMYENFLPRSADDRDVKTRASTLLDQIDFHVENFYKSRRASRDSLKEASVQIFDSGLLPKPLFSVLLESKNVVPILKHTLAFVITDAISATAHARWSLLPDDFVLLPRAVASVRPKATESEKPGFAQSFSRWRALTAYLRPDVSQDKSYMKQRNLKIQELVQDFCSTFAVLMSDEYKDEERLQNLSAILQEAADFGIWLFSQPCDLRFSWPNAEHERSNEFAVLPALVKMGNEDGQKLKTPQVLTQATIQKA